MAPFASLEKQAEILFWLICCERKILFQLKKTDYKRSEHGHNIMHKRGINATGIATLLYIVVVLGVESP